MQEVNFFDAYCYDDIETIQFTIIVPGVPSPLNLQKAVKLILDGKVFFSGGICETDYFDHCIDQICECEEKEGSADE